MNSSLFFPKNCVLPFKLKIPHFAWNFCLQRLQMTQLINQESVGTREPDTFRCCSSKTNHCRHIFKVEVKNAFSKMLVFLTVSPGRSFSIRKATTKNRTASYILTTGANSGGFQKICYNIPGTRKLGSLCVEKDHNWKLEAQISTFSTEKL